MRRQDDRLLEKPLWFVTPSQSDLDNPKGALTVQQRRQKGLAREENKLTKSLQGMELVAQVENLREGVRQKWAIEVENYVKEFHSVGRKPVAPNHTEAANSASGRRTFFGPRKEQTAATAPSQ